MLKHYDKAHFIVYSNDVEPFRANGDNYCASALRAGFDTATHYKEEDLRKTPFWSENAGILEQERGAGYWLWKPHLVLQKLREVGPNDVVVYNDIGRYAVGSFEPFPRLPLAAINLAALSPKRFLHGFKTDWLVQGNYTKRDCFIALDADTEEMHRASQVSGCPLFYLPSQDSFDFLETWLELAKNPHLLTDIPDELGAPLPEFEDHRHDMAIASILLHQKKGHYFDISKEGGYIYAEDVRRRNPHVPRIQTHAGYMSLMLERSLPDDFFMREAPDLALAAAMVHNLTDGEAVPVHQRVTLRSELADEFAIKLRLKQTNVTQAHLEAALSVNKISSNKVLALSKLPAEQTAPLWDKAVAHCTSVLTAVFEQEVDVTAFDVSVRALQASEVLYPDIRTEMMIGLIWGALSDDARGLFKSKHKNAKNERGRTAIRNFITTTGQDVLLSHAAEIEGRYKEQSDLISEKMVAWLVNT
jgi:hypothetical protein